MISYALSPLASAPRTARSRVPLVRMVLVASMFLFALAPRLAALSPPAGKIVLTITGNIAFTNGVERADFDLAMLEALPQHSFSTRTPWYPTARTFSGPRLRDVLIAVGAQGESLGASALNDYKTSIPFDDARKFDVIIALKLDEKPMTVREKGPLFIIYPFDSKKELNTELYYNRSAWQLRKLEVK
ncbi:MAG: molybdopterin-dependent oxidoreductase [Opitutaceae bacterium]|nr:molybdopterin-dependent oxidoreductase [Opitutaceae bacterium]